MYNASYVLLSAEVTYKGYFVIQQQPKEQNKALDLWSLPALSQIHTSFELATITFILFSWILSTLLCCIDLEISPWCMVNPKSRIV